MLIACTVQQGLSFQSVKVSFRQSLLVKFTRAGMKGYAVTQLSPFTQRTTLLNCKNVIPAI